MFITTAGGGMIASSLLGGLLGSKGSSTSNSSQQTLDPRMADAVYGVNGVIPSAQDWYSKNKTGLNAMMLEGMDNTYNQLGASRQGYNQMQNLGMGLLGGGAAGNPFAGGYGGGTDFSGGMNGRGGGIAPQAMSYTPASASNTTSPFAAQYALDGIQRAKDAEAARLKALADAALLAQRMTIAPPVYSSGGMDSYSGSGGGMGYGNGSGGGYGGPGDGMGANSTDGGFGGGYSNMA